MTTEIVHKEGIGRCLVASRDLEPLELILSDSPVVWGPEELTSDLVCLACCKVIADDFR